MEKIMAEEEKAEAPAEEAEAAKAEAPTEKEQAEPEKTETETPATTEAQAQAEEPEEAKAEPAAPKDEGPKLTAREIEKMNVPKLKEAALQYGGRISGVHGMDKAQLVTVLKEINDIPLQVARKSSKIDRQGVKQKIKGLKRERDGAIEDKDPVKLKRVRIRVKALRRKLIRSG
jgi:hypothetical protein